jgi:hypothetical protein
MGVKNDKALLPHTTKVEVCKVGDMLFAVVMLMKLQMLYLYGSIARKFAKNLKFRHFC